MSDYNLKRHVIAVQRDLEALLKLLGGTEEERERFREIVLGITRPVEFRLVSHQLKGIQENLKSAHESLQVITSVAQETRA